MTAWWSDTRIDATVSQEYIERELGAKKHVDTLHRVLAFGDGLTDDTYLDWILERSPRIFLILNHIGVPEKVFEVIDRSLADDDLPLSQDTLWELNLFGGKSETLDKKFYREQFNFLIQELEPGGHVDYGTWEIVPVEPTLKRPGIANGNSQVSLDRVVVQSNIYTRKKVATFGDNGIDDVHFIMHLKALTALHHSHLVTVWATYSQDEFNYILLNPATDMNLKVFLEEPPKAFKLLEKHERRNIFLTWTHCLTSAVAYLHDKGLTHQTLRPSTISVDHKYTVFVNDYSALKALDVDESNSPYSGELYDHAAPENWTRQPCLHETAPLKTYLPGGGRTSRRIPKHQSIEPKHKLALPQTPTTQRSRTASKSNSSGSSTNVKPRNALITTFAPRERAASIASSTTSHRACASDIFSLTTVILTVLSMILQHSPKSFASHRCRLNRQAGRGNAPPDSSFHKNLNQVTKWMDMLAKEAGQREKKDMKFWGSVVELVQVCRLGIRKEAKERINARDLEKKIGGWLEWGLGRRRRCGCMTAGESGQVEIINGEEVEEPTSKYSLTKKPQPSKSFTVKDRRPPTSKRQLTADHTTERSVSEPTISMHLSSMGRTSLPSSKQTPHEESTVWGLDDLSQLHSGMLRSASIVSDDKESTVWGLLESKPVLTAPPATHPPPRDPPPSNPLPERPQTSGGEGIIWGLRDVRAGEKDGVGGMRFPAVPTGYSSAVLDLDGSSRAESVTTSCIAVGVPGGESVYGSGSEEGSEETEQGGRKEDWPLPLGSFTLEGR